MAQSNMKAATEESPAKTNQTSTGNPYLFAFLMVASLFFIWGFCHAMLDVLNKHFQNILNISKAQSGLVETSVFIPYLLLAFPAALMNRRIGYQRSILVGLVILATGAFLFIPARLVFKTFWSFLAALFVLSTGLACIETAAKSTDRAGPEGAPGRLSVAQAFNSCAYIIAPTLGGFLLFRHKAEAGAPVDFHNLILPYVVLGCVVLAIMALFQLNYLLLMAIIKPRMLTTPPFSKLPCPVYRISSGVSSPSSFILFRRSGSWPLP